jgi:hypothetical protein
MKPQLAPLTPQAFGYEPTPYVACAICGASTPMLNTRRCDSCWEIERRIDDLDAIALARLGYVRIPEALARIARREPT